MEEEFQENQYPNLKHVFLVILITLTVTFVLSAIGAKVGGNTELFLFEIIIIIPALFYTFRYKYSFKKLFRLNSVNWHVIAMSIILGIAFTVISDEIDRLIEIIIPMPEILRQALEKSLIINSFSDFIIITFSSVILASVCEEMLFRGFVQTSMENTFDVTRAVMSTALIFTVVHFNPWWSIQIILFGIILGVMSWKSNSIIPPIIVHFINNGIALIYNNLKPEQYQWYLYKGHVQIPIVIGALILVFYGFKLFYRFCEAGDQS